MTNKVDEINVSGAPEQKTQGSLEGLGGSEVRNLNDEIEQPAGVRIRTEPSSDVQKYLEHLASPAVRNADNELLGAIHIGRLTVGYVDEINGPGAEEILGFVPTRHELIHLAKYWAKVGINIDYFWFCYQQTGSSEMRRGRFAWRRVDRIADVLGDEVVKAAVDKAYEEYGKDQDPRTWNIFLNGTPEERTALQEEIAREMCENNEALSGSEPSSGNNEPTDGTERAA